MDAETELSGDSKAWKDIWSAGQGVGAVSAVAPTKEIITNLKNEYQQALNQLNQSTKAYR